MSLVKRVESNSSVFGVNLLAAQAALCVFIAAGSNEQNISVTRWFI